MPSNPLILKRQRIAQTRLFQVEQLDLRFSNDVERTYERITSAGYGAVAVVPVTTEGSVILVQEYSAGINAYQWGLPKGAIDPGEDNLTAANRELKEEAGVGARELRFLKRVHLTPSYMERSIDVLVAWGLYEASLPGDEPEPMASMQWPIDNLAELVARDDVSDSISITALYMVRDYLQLSPID